MSEPTQPNATVFEDIQKSVTSTVASAEAPASATSQKKVPRTIYDASAGEVFLKNFLAGVGHSLGSIMIYFIFIFVMAVLAIQFIWPMVEPYVKLYQDSMKSIQNFQNIMPGGISSGESGAIPTSGWNIDFLSDVEKQQLQNSINDNINQRFQQQQPSQGE